MPLCVPLQYWFLRNPILDKIRSRETWSQYNVVSTLIFSIFSNSIQFIQLSTFGPPASHYTITQHMMSNYALRYSGVVSETEKACKRFLVLAGVNPLNGINSKSQEWGKMDSKSTLRLPWQLPPPLQLIRTWGESWILGQVLFLMIEIRSDRAEVVPKAQQPPQS